MKTFVAIFFLIALVPAAAFAQTNQRSPAQSPLTAAPTLSPMASLPPGIGSQPGAPNNMPGAGAMPPMPGPPAGVGARSMPAVPQFNEPAIPQPTQHVPIPSPTSSSLSLIPFLDSTAPYVQAFDFVLMIVAGIFCLSARNARGLTILAISCFVSAIILLGFFLFGIFHGQGALPQTAYIIARLLAPFELLLFAIAIILVARANAAPKS